MDEIESVVPQLTKIPFEVSQSFVHGVTSELVERTGRQGERDHRFSGNPGGRDHADVGALVGSLQRFPGGKVHRLQGAAERGYRFQVATHANLFAIGNATLDSAGVVSAAAKTAEAVFFLVSNFIVHRRTGRTSGGNARANLNPLHRLQRHDGG